MDVIPGRCNDCGEVIINVPARAGLSPEKIAADVKAAFAKHVAKTGCRELEAPVIAAIPDAPVTVELVCAGCGLIVAALPASEARRDPAGTQRLANEAMRVHVKATGCPGQHQAGTSTPLRRDPRCVNQSEAAEENSGGALAETIHVPDCRCEKPAPAKPAVEKLDQGVMRFG